MEHALVPTDHEPDLVTRGQGFKHAQQVDVGSPAVGETVSEMEEARHVQRELSPESRPGGPASFRGAG